MSLVSIIVPVYNTADYIENCLNSLIRQTYDNLEIILINDGSNDDSYSICRRYENIDKRVVFLSKNNSGVSDTRNLGIEISKGDYVLFVDSDDYILEDHVEVLLKGILKYKADICIAGYFRKEQHDTINKYNKNNYSYVLSRKEAIRKILLREEFDGAAVAKLYSRNMIKDVRFDIKEKMWEDLFFSLLAINNASRVCFMKNRSYCYIDRESSATHNLKLFNKESVLYSFKKLNSFIKKNHPDLIYLLHVVYVNVYLDLFYKFTTLSKIRDDEQSLKDISASIRANLLPYCFCLSVSMKKKIKATLISCNYKIFLKAKVFFKRIRGRG